MRLRPPSAVVPAFAAFLACGAFSAPAFAVREPGALKGSSGSAMAVVCLIFLAALIIGVSMMNPRRTHQD